MFFFLVFLFLSTTCTATILTNPCKAGEREALFRFKGDLQEQGAGLLSSWTGDNCCSNWTGVACDNQTGHVVELLLNSLNHRLKGKINPSLHELPYLQRLDLSGNALYGALPPQLGNLTNLEILVLNDNPLGGEIPVSLGRLNRLSRLSLSFNGMQGAIPSSLGNLTSCWKLDLSNNNLTGSIPSSLGGLTSLVELDLTFNSLNGPISNFLSKLANLAILSLKGNDLSGVLTGHDLDALSRLTHLYLAHNSLELSFASNWVSPFQLEVVDLSYCKVGPSFPGWIRTQTRLYYLNLSSSGISGSLAKWVWDLPLQFLDLSWNNITGSIPSIIIPPRELLNLAHNRIEGPLPQLNNVSTGFSSLFLSSNLLSGDIPASYCTLADLLILDLSSNRIKGEIPRCLLDKLPSLELLNLARNQLRGEVGAFGSSCQLRGLLLSENNLSGPIPASLKNCKELTFLDIGMNNFTGLLPSWIGKSVPKLKALLAASNGLSGEIPGELQLLSLLQILDLSGNKFSGRIPGGLGNFSAMRNLTSTYPPYRDYDPILESGFNFGNGEVYPWPLLPSTSLNAKGQSREYSLLLPLVLLMDLSSNRLTGEIPAELSSLRDLRFLNLSRNRLTGRIPEDIGGLENMESLDLSWNDLEGGIPRSMTRMKFLNVLDLSHNNLSGRIPTGPQLTTIGSSSYVGNPWLCGAPLLQVCEEGRREGDSRDHDAGHLDSLFFFTSLALGFVTGFWTLYGTLWVKGAWRIAYFRTIDSFLAKICALFRK